MTAETAAAPEVMEEVIRLPKLSSEQLRAGLLSDNADVRMAALTLTIQPDARIDGCVEAIASCVDRGRDDPLIGGIAVVALSSVKVDAEKPAAVACLLTLVTPDNSADVRSWAAHGMVQYGAIPEAAWPHVAPLLFDEDIYVRKTVLKAITPYAVTGAAHIAQSTSAVGPVAWTTEGLTALALSAGTSDDNKRRVENYLVRSLEGQSIFPTAIAGYAAVAQLNPKSSAPLLLAKIAAGADDGAALAAIDAIARLGISASGATPALVEALIQTEHVEREDALCKALVQLQIRAADVPLPRVLQRIADAEGSVALAHCSLLCLHARAFSATASVVAARHAKSGETLQDALSEVHLSLAGRKLAPVAPQSAAKP